MRFHNFILVIITSFLFFTSFTPAPKGYTYQSAEGKLSVVFPGDYATERTEGNNNTTVKTSCTVNDQTYFVSYTLHSLELTDPVDLAEVSYDSFINSLDGVLLSKSEWKIKNNTGLKAIIDLPVQDSKLDYRVIIVGNIQYQLIALAANYDYNENDAAAFFKSFKIEK